MFKLLGYLNTISKLARICVK